MSGSRLTSFAADRARIAEMTALRNGVEPPARNSAMDRFTIAAGHDADVLRALIETSLCLALPQEVFERPGIKEKIDKVEGAVPMRMPDRTETSYSGCSVPDAWMRCTDTV